MAMGITYSTRIQLPTARMLTRSKTPHVSSLRCTKGDTDTPPSSSSTDSKSSVSERERRRQLRQELVRKVFKDVTKDMDMSDYPPWMDDEGDPNWNEDEPDEGWGFDISKFFTRPEKVKNATGANESDESEDEIPDEEWDREDHFEWMVWEMSQEEWHEVIWEDKRPILVLVFERYGPRARACWNTLKELEKAVKTFYDKKKIALRAAKIDAQRDKDMAAALKLESVPALLVIRESKLLHRIYGTRTEDEILQATAHFFHGARRPAFLGSGLTTPEFVPEYNSKEKKDEKKGVKEKSGIVPECKKKENKQEKKGKRPEKNVGKSGAT